METRREIIRQAGNGKKPRRHDFDIGIDGAALRAGDGVHEDAAAQFLWTYNVTPRWFVEGFFGGLIHNGNLDDISDNMNGLGCRWAFHSGGSIGYRLNDRWSVMGTFDHLSNGQLCSLNKGINDFGLRAAYSF